MMVLFTFIVKITADQKSLKVERKFLILGVVNSIKKYLNVKLFEQQCILDELTTKVIGLSEGQTNYDREMLMKSKLERLHKITLTFGDLNNFIDFNVELKEDDDSIRKIL